MTDSCGSTNTTTGHPCKNDADSCPWHDTDDPPETGRPSKLTKDRQERIATAIEEGMPLVAACRLNSITYQTHQNWMDKGEEQEEDIYAEYFERLARALGHDQAKKTATIWDKAVEQGNVGMMLTVLKQRYPETWQDQDIGEAAAQNVINIPESVAKEWQHNKPKR